LVSWKVGKKAKGIRQKAKVGKVESWKGGKLGNWKVGKLVMW
jgi:hypothetical protein